MHLLNSLVCKTIGHEPRYCQDRVIINGQWRWQKHASCGRCDSADSAEIHTPGIFDFPAWLHISGDAVRFSFADWHRAKRRALLRSFRKRSP